jgi:hypothetical protein
MKKILILLSVSILISACKTSSHGNCDAYGLVDEKEEFDVHKMHFEQQMKYSSVTSIK